MDEMIEQQTDCFMALFKSRHIEDDVYYMFEWLFIKEFANDDYLKLKEEERIVVDFITKEKRYRVTNEQEKEQFLFIYEKAMLYRKKYKFESLYTTLEKMWELLNGYQTDRLWKFNSKKDIEDYVEVLFGNRKILSLRKKTINTIFKTLNNLKDVTEVKIINDRKIEYYSNNVKFEIIIPIPHQLTEE